MPRCLMLSMQPDRTAIAGLIRTLGIEVAETDDRHMVIAEIAVRKWDAVMVESVLPKQSGQDFIKTVSELKTSCRKFILLCDRYDEFPEIYFSVFGITGVMPRPLNSVQKLKAILHTYRII